MYQLALLKAENQNLREANETLSKRRRAKKHIYGKEGHLVNGKQRIYKMIETFRCG
jgi:hypothetical protein